MVSAFKPLIVWVDTGYNTDATLKYSKDIIDLLGLNVVRYTAAPWKNEIPPVGTLDHKEFVDQVKLVPFRLAVKGLRPEFWIAGLRKEQTEHRKGLQQIDQIDGITKICPLLEWTSEDMNEYIVKYNLPNEPVYFDPTKVSTNTECGLHTIESLHLEA